MIACPSGKIRYRSSEAADAVIGKLWRRPVPGGKKLPARSYLCDRCPYWHITSLGIVPDEYQVSEAAAVTVREVKPSWIDVGIRITRLRKAIGMSVEEFSAAIGMKPVKLQYMEYVGTRVSRERLATIAELTGTTVDWLRYGSLADRLDERS